MRHLHPGERIIQFRKHLELSQEAFADEIGVSRSNISKIESDKLGLSNAVLNAMKLRFAVNPEWIRTGEGEMLIAPEEYIAKGIALLGARRFHEGLAKVLQNPQFAEFQSAAAFGEFVKEHADGELAGYLQYILDFWHQGDERKRHWLLYELEQVFPEGKRQGKKESDGENRRME